MKKGQLPERPESLKPGMGYILKPSFPLARKLPSPCYGRHFLEYYKETTAAPEFLLVSVAPGKKETQLSKKSLNVDFVFTSGCGVRASFKLLNHVLKE